MECLGELCDLSGDPFQKLPNSPLNRGRVANTGDGEMQMRFLCGLSLLDTACLCFPSGCLWQAHHLTSSKPNGPLIFTAEMETAVFAA